MTITGPDSHLSKHPDLLILIFLLSFKSFIFTFLKFNNKLPFPVFNYKAYISAIDILCGTIKSFITINRSEAEHVARF